MKYLFLLFALLGATLLHAQNGGQEPENNAVRLDFGGFYGTYTIIKVTNKQACPATVKLTTTTTTVTKTVAASSVDTVHLLLSGVAAKVQAKAQTNCGNADLGNVELVLNIVALPIKFTFFTVRKRLQHETH